MENIWLSSYDESNQWSPHTWRKIKNMTQSTTLLHALLTQCQAISLLNIAYRTMPLYHWLVWSMRQPSNLLINDDTFSPAQITITISKLMNRSHLRLHLPSEIKSSIKIVIDVKLSDIIILCQKMRFVLWYHDMVCQWITLIWWSKIQPLLPKIYSSKCRHYLQCSHHMTLLPTSKKSIIQSKIRSLLNNKAKISQLARFLLIILISIELKVPWWFYHQSHPSHEVEG